MAINLVQGESDGDDVVSAINTTPLVDVMLVLLIIFLITIPVVVHTVPVNLPKERNQPRQIKPQTVTITVDRAGDVFWGAARMADNDALLARLKAAAVKVPQPDVQIRGDMDARYEGIGKVVFDCQRAGIAKVGFVIQPPANGG